MAGANRRARELNGPALSRVLSDLFCSGGGAGPAADRERACSAFGHSAPWLEEGRPRKSSKAVREGAGRRKTPGNRRAPEGRTGHRHGGKRPRRRRHLRPEVEQRYEAASGLGDAAPVQSGARRVEVKVIGPMPWALGDWPHAAPKDLRAIGRGGGMDPFRPGQYGPGHPRGADDAAPEQFLSAGRCSGPIS